MMRWQMLSGIGRHLRQPCSMSHRSSRSQPDSPLWDLPNCRITPHDSCHVDASYMRTAEFFFTNLNHLANREPLEWTVTDIELSDPSVGDV